MSISHEFFRRGSFPALIRICEHASVHPAALGAKHGMLAAEVYELLKPLGKPNIIGKLLAQLQITRPDHRKIGGERELGLVRC